MKDFSRSITLDFQKRLNSSDVDHLSVILSKIEEFDEFFISSVSLTVWYVPYLISETTVRKMIINTGFPVKMRRHKSGIIRKFLDNLAKNSYEAFGNKKPDCCGLNTKYHN